MKKGLFKKHAMIGALSVLAFSAHAGPEDDLLEALAKQTAVPATRVRSAPSTAVMDQAVTVWEADQTADTKNLRTTKAVKEAIELMYEAGASNTLIDRWLSTSEADASNLTKDKLKALGVWSALPTVKAHLQEDMLTNWVAWLTAHEGDLSGPALMPRMPANDQVFLTMIYDALSGFVGQILPFSGMVPALGDVAKLPLGRIVSESDREKLALALSFACSFDDRSIAAHGHGADGSMTKARAAGATADDEQKMGKELWTAFKARASLKVSFTFSFGFFWSALRKFETTNTTRTPGNVLIQDTDFWAGFRAAVREDSSVRRLIA